MLVGVGMKICGSNIYHLINVIENSIDWCVHIKSPLFHHILTLGKHIRRDFCISVKYMLGDYVNDILDGVIVVIAQGSDLLHVDRCDDFLK